MNVYQYQVLGCCLQDSRARSKLKGFIVISNASASALGLNDGFFSAGMLYGLVFLGGVMNEFCSLAVAEALGEAGVALVGW